MTGAEVLTGVGFGACLVGFGLFGGEALTAAQLACSAAIVGAVVLVTARPPAEDRLSSPAEGA